jgi:hypothetical protein
VDCFLGRVGVDGQFPAASFGLSLDAKAEEVDDPRGIEQAAKAAGDVLSGYKDLISIDGTPGAFSEDSHEILSGFFELKRGGLGLVS